MSYPTPPRPGAARDIFRIQIDDHVVISGDQSLIKGLNDAGLAAVVRQAARIQGLALDEARKRRQALDELLEADQADGLFDGGGGQS